ncbi:MAG TPA: DUF5335 family protein [Gammaproteobacteria bacterium]|nr:DUF5335 family protein [Gammaproteobacteria bacterium]
MTMTRLPRGEWRSFCDSVSRSLVDAHAEIEVASVALGDRVEARWLPIYGVTYDPRADTVEIVLEGVDHTIARPRDLYAERTRRGLVALEIVEEDETRQSVRLREPLPVRDPTSAHGPGQSIEAD